MNIPCANKKFIRGSHCPFRNKKDSKTIMKLPELHRKYVKIHTNGARLMHKSKKKKNAPLLFGNQRNILRGRVEGGEFRHESCHRKQEILTIKPLF